MESTLVDTIKEADKLGYSIDFNRSPWKDKLQLNPTDFSIDNIFRFEGMTNPEDEAILYTLSSTTLDLKGYLLNGYGVYSEEWIDNVVHKLNVRNNA